MNQMHRSLCLALAVISLMIPQSTYAMTSQLSLGTKLEKRELKNQSNHFSIDDGFIWAQLELNPSKNGKVCFIWTLNGKPYTKFNTPIKNSPRYRTQSYVTARTGHWHVTVMSDAKVVLAEKDFIVEGKVMTEKSSSTVIHDKSKLNFNDKAQKAAPTKEKSVSGIAEALKAISPSDTRIINKSTLKKHATKVSEKPIEKKA
ncbi:MAG: DUF2914 domain-containing protein [Candidatus Paracaedibacteraceae bacterium]|nr:DUF2914 domain-containing protein [Candidatus Paracaedibacteraceae bacterium]